MAGIGIQVVSLSVRVWALPVRPLSRRIPPSPSPFLPPRLYILNFPPVRFRYTLCVPTLAGPISAKKEHQKFGLDCPFGPLGVLIKEDQTAPYQTAPPKLH